MVHANTEPPVGRIADAPTPYSLFAREDKAAAEAHEAWGPQTRFRNIDGSTIYVFPAWDVIGLDDLLCAISLCMQRHLRPLCAEPIT